MDYKTVDEYLLSFPGARRDYPFGEEVAVYKVPASSNSEEKNVCANP
jgi:predicted DNA-binding protein (MmcQ/YjbR family)